MSSLARRTLILGDLHLTPVTPRAVTDDLARLLEAHRGARIVFAGDLFDFSAVMPGAPHAAAVHETFAAHPHARRALGAHLESEGEIILASGNHDADVGQAHFRGVLSAELGLGHGERGRLRTTPWFFREGALHVEHGHFHDPDNAPAHPLVVGEPSLGVHFVERFIAPTGAHRFLHRTDETPLELLVASFAWYGPRAPYVIYTYFRAAVSAMLRSGPFYRAAGERARGRAEEPGFAETMGVDPELVGALLALGPSPTLESASQTFTRLYFDRVLATLGISGGLAALALGRAAGGGAAVSLGALLMALSWARGHDRYGGTVAERLAAGARRIAETTGAKLVVFGHTHREELAGTYANTGSFAFPTLGGRPFLEIEGGPSDPRAVPRRLAPGS